MIVLYYKKRDLSIIIYYMTKKHTELFGNFILTNESNYDIMNEFHHKRAGVNT